MQSSIMCMEHMLIVWFVVHAIDSEFNSHVNFTWDLFCPTFMVCNVGQLITEVHLMG